MQRNSDKCSHCGRMFVRGNEETPTINRSGTTFHVSLFSGPDPRPNISGQFVCNFAYVDDYLVPERKFLIVYVLPAIRGREELLRQVEIAADGIAELLQAGRSLELAYTVRGGVFAPGVAK